MSRKFYACQCLFKKGREGIKQYFGKTVYVFRNAKDRDDFVVAKDEKEFFTITQKEAYAIADLRKPNSIPCVYTHSQYRDMNVLANVRQCYGSAYTPLSEFA